MKSISLSFWLVLSIVFLCLSVTVLFMFIRPFNTGSEPDSELFARYGSFIGGVIGTFLSILSIILIYNTFQSQQKQFDAQENFFKRERFESLFFEMVRANRQIVAEMLFKTPDDFLAAETRTDVNKGVASFTHLSGQKVFVKFRLHFMQARKETDDLIAHAWDNNKFFSDQARSREEAIFRNYLGDRYHSDILREASAINIIYHCVFYGVSRYGQYDVFYTLKKTYDEQLIKKIIERLRCKPVKWEKEPWKIYSEARNQRFADFNPQNISTGDFVKYYGGHHHRFGQYFRQMFTLLNFVNNQSGLSFNDKMHYVSVFKSQLSTFEQAVLFLNSISFPGRAWELQAEQNAKPDNIFDKRLITKYDLITNLSDYFLEGIEASKYFPFVEFESRETVSEKELLKKKYS